MLVVDDSAAVRREVARALEAGGDFEPARECADGLAALRAMAERRPDVVLCDMEMPGCDGLRFLRLRAANAELLQVPVLMLTGTDDQERKIEALERGAADYLIKPFHQRELLARVRIHYRLRVLQDELEEANRRLTELSLVDEVTGLYNRRSLDQRLEAEVARVRRYGGELSLVLLDLDHFKQVNDGHGHDAGDLVLRNVSGLVKATVREVDLAARYGGEELALVLPSTGASGAVTVAERLRRSLEQHEHVTHGGARLRVTASFGVATASGRDAADVAALLRRVDQALYAAKHEGRNRVVLSPEGRGGL